MLRRLIQLIRYNPFVRLGWALIAFNKDNRLGTKEIGLAIAERFGVWLIFVVVTIELLRILISLELQAIGLVMGFDGAFVLAWATFGQLVDDLVNRSAVSDPRTSLDVEEQAPITKGDES